MSESETASESDFVDPPLYCIPPPCRLCRYALAPSVVVVAGKHARKLSPLARAIPGLTCQSTDVHGRISQPYPYDDDVHDDNQTMFFICSRLIPSSLCRAVARLPPYLYRV